eukprot:146327-Prymnesium_polylepis.1
MDGSAAGGEHSASACRATRVRRAGLGRPVERPPHAACHVMPYRAACCLLQSCGCARRCDAVAER